MGIAHVYLYSKRPKRARGVTKSAPAQEDSSEEDSGVNGGGITITFGSGGGFAGFHGSSNNIFGQGANVGFVGRDNIFGRGGRIGMGGQPGIQVVNDRRGGRRR